jgi:hypothetical protein
MTLATMTPKNKAIIDCSRLIQKPSAAATSNAASYLWSKSLGRA